MNDQEKIEQLRTLSDAGLFSRQIVERAPEDFYNDIGTLACGHRTSVPRSGIYTEWECSHCRKEFEPKRQPFEKRWLGRGYVIFVPFILLVIFYAVMLPRWIEEGAKRDAAKEQELQGLQQRVTALEEQIKLRR